MVKNPFRDLARALLCLLLIACGFDLHAAARATIDRNPVSLDETFGLVIESDASDQGEPDLAPVRELFDIVGQSQSSSYQIINNRASSQRRWNLTLAPRQPGQAVIPAIPIGRERTAPITLTVTPSAQATPGEAELSVEMEVEPKDPYVQQQVVVTVKLWRSVELAQGATLSDPTLPGADAVLERIGEDTQYRATRGGRQYAVFERRYALYPQRSGEFAIGPVQFDGRVMEQGRGGFSLDPFGHATRPKRVRSEPVNLTVRPRPAAASGPWLPARQVTLVEQWSPDPPLFKVGEPVTRTLALMADGLTAAQLPTLAPSPPTGLKAYADQPELRDNKGPGGITGTRQEKVALVPTAPGRLTLPAIELQWWNTATGKAEVARLPARTVEVQPAPGSTTASAPQPAPAASLPATPVADSTAAVPAAAAWWPWVSLALAVGWGATAVGWWWQARRPHAREGTRPTGTAGDERRLRERVEQACRANNPEAARTALLAWARQRSSGRPPVSLIAIGPLVDNRLRLELEALDRHLYASAPHDWDGSGLRQALLEQGPGGTGPTAGDEPLAPMWPSPRTE